MSARTDVSLVKAQRDDAERLADICKRAFNSDRLYGVPKAEGGDEVRLEGVQVKSYRGDLQISAGYTGHIIKLI